MFVVWQRQALSEYCIQMRKEASCRAEGKTARNEGCGQSDSIRVSLALQVMLGIIAFANNWPKTFFECGVAGRQGSEKIRASITT